MTTHARALTKRDIAALSAEAYAPTVSATDIRALVNGLARLGYDRADLLSAAGLSAADITDPDARYHCALHMMIVDRAQRSSPRHNLAFHVAAATPANEYRTMGYLIHSSDTVGAGFHQLARYFRLTGSPVVVTIREEQVPVQVLIQCPPAPFAEEYTTALAVFHFRDDTDPPFRPRRVTFAHKVDDVGECERLIGSTVEDLAPWSGLEIDPNVWRLPLRGRDPILREVLERYATEIAARLPVPDDFVLTLRRVLAVRVVGGDTRIETIARFLAATPRTLQRRLAALGLSYQDVVDEMRRETAERLLDDPTLSIAEIAYLLGYSERAAFHRAFRRWLGITPQQYRDRATGVAQAAHRTAATQSGD